MNRRVARIAACVFVIGSCGATARMASAAPSAPEETVAILFARPLPDVPGRSFTTAVVTLAPGAKAKPHRHGEAFVYAYVLEGTVRSQLDDERAVVYRTGESWFEPPGARHRLTENVSGARTARLLVVFVAPTGAPLKTPMP